MRTTLYMASLTRDLRPSEEQVLFDCLPPERKRRFLRMKRASGRAEILCAYGLLCVALRRELGWHSLPDIRVTETGKPFFPAYPGVCFSLSHTDGAVMAGLSDAPIGVDIQKQRPVTARIMRRTADTNDPEEFFRRWVSMEACGKRDGRGILYAMHADAPFYEGYVPLDTFPGYYAGTAVTPGHVPIKPCCYTV